MLENSPHHQLGPMHRVLIIEELLERIIDWAVELNGMSSIPALARVCSLFFEPTVRRIWRVLPGLEHILNAMPPPLVYRTNRVSTPDIIIISPLFADRHYHAPVDFQRMQFYLRLIREVVTEDIDIIGEIFDAFVRASTTLKLIHHLSDDQVALPMVNTLTFKFARISRLHRIEDTAIDWLTSLCGEELTGIHFPFVDVSPKFPRSVGWQHFVVENLTSSPAAVLDVLSETIFHAILEQRDKLKHLTLRLDDGYDQPIPDSMAQGIAEPGTRRFVTETFGFLSACRGLRSLVLSIPISGALLRKLGDLSALQRLSVTIGQCVANGCLDLALEDPDDVEAEKIRELGSDRPRPFVSLQELSIHFPTSWSSQRPIANEVAHLFRSAECYPQISLVVDAGYQYFSPENKVSTMLDVLTHPRYSKSLRAFSLLAISDLHDRDFSTVGRLRLHDLSPLYRNDRCPNLAELEIDGSNMFVEVKDADLLALGRACPKLEVLKLGTPALEDALTVKDSVRICTLKRFTKSCPRLRDLQLFLTPWRYGDLIRSTEGRNRVVPYWQATLLEARKERLKVMWW